MSVPAAAHKNEGGHEEGKKNPKLCILILLVLHYAVCISESSKVVSSFSFSSLCYYRREIKKKTVSYFSVLSKSQDHLNFLY